VAVVAAAIACGMLAACGLPAEDSPRLLPADGLGLTETTTTTTSVPSTTDEPTPPVTQPPVPTQPITLYFVRGDSLVPVTRELRSPPDLPSVLASLVGGPNPVEDADGLRSTLPIGAVVRVFPERGVATVDLKPGLFDEVLPDEQVLAFAQLVLTLSAQPGIGQVRFTMGGQPVQAQKGDGSLAPVNVPLTFEDYETLIEGYEPPPTTSTTTTTTTTTTVAPAVPPPSV
jgi:Sporulation and spore germination